MHKKTVAEVDEFKYLWKFKHLKLWAEQLAILPFNFNSSQALIYQEFFSQGDLEKALGKNPLEMMDRERACVPELQISFLDNIAYPVYR